MESPIVVNTHDDYDHDLHRQELLDLPPGFRFHPTDEEIITHYLTEKVMNTSFQAYAIGEVDLNKSEPWDLPSKAKMGEKEFYFFCQRDRKYPTGMRTNRATVAGYWKATGKDKEIYNKGKSGNHNKNYLVGMKKTLVFYKGRAPKGEKSNWVMHEYRLDGKFSYYNLPKDAKDEWVVCRVFHKNTAAAAAAGIRKIPSVNYHHQGMMMTMMPSSFNGDEFLYDPYAASLPALMDPPSAVAAAAASGSPSTSSRSYFLDQNSHPQTQNQSQASYDHAGGAMMSSGGYGGGSGQYQYQYQQCKAEQFSFTTNQSSAMISRSQDTTGALSTDRNTTAEISSVVSKLQQDDYRDLDATSIAEFDSFCWDY